MTQKESLLKMFRDNHYILTLGEIMRTNLAAEYRARMTDLRKQGYRIELIERHPEAPSSNIYQLTEKPIVEPGGQVVLL